MTNSNSLREMVDSAFSPQLSSLEFRSIEIADDFVRIESPKVVIDIHYDFRRSFEVAMGFSLKESAAESERIPFNLGEVFRECEVPDADRCSFFASTERRYVQVFLRSVIDRLIRHCMPVLLGEQDLFDALTKRRAREAGVYTHELHDQPIRELAEVAWRGKNFADYVSLMKRIHTELSKVEQSRLDYAVKRVRGEK